MSVDRFTLAERQRCRDLVEIRIAMLLASDSLAPDHPANRETRAVLRCLYRLRDEIAAGPVMEAADV